MTLDLLRYKVLKIIFSYRKCLRKQKFLKKAKSRSLKNYIISCTNFPNQNGIISLFMFESPCFIVCLLIIKGFPKLYFLRWRTIKIVESFGKNRWRYSSGTWNARPTTGILDFLFATFPSALNHPLLMFLFWCLKELGDRNHSSFWHFLQTLF